MTTALGIRPDARSNGVSPQVHRHIISAQWTSDGIIQGLDVTGGTGLTYTVSAGTALIQPDGQKGEAVLAYWPGGATPAVGAGNAGLSRYDVIWLRAHDIDKGDADNQVVLGVTQGTPAADPDVPLDQVPSDVVRLAAMLVPAGMTQTKSCSTDGAERYAMPYGASKGLIARNVRNYEGPANMGDGGKDYFEQDTSFYLPTDRLGQRARAPARGPPLPTRQSQEAHRGRHTDGLLVCRLSDRRQGRVRWRRAVPGEPSMAAGASERLGVIAGRMAHRPYPQPQGRVG